MFEEFELMVLKAGPPPTLQLVLIDYEIPSIPAIA
jgi:hypothetical protein